MGEDVTDKQSGKGPYGPIITKILVFLMAVVILTILVATISYVMNAKDPDYEKGYMAGYRSSYQAGFNGDIFDVKSGLNKESSYNNGYHQGYDDGYPDGQTDRDRQVPNNNAPSIITSSMTGNITSNKTSNLTINTTSNETNKTTWKNRKNTLNYSNFFYLIPVMYKILKGFLAGWIEKPGLSMEVIRCVDWPIPRLTFNQLILHR